MRCESQQGEWDPCRDINCYSQDPAERKWLQDLHIRLDKLGAWSRNDYDVGCYRYPMSVRVKPGSPMLFSKEYALPAHHKEPARKLLEKLLRQGIIEPLKAGTIPQNISPAFLVKKAHEEYQQGDKGQGNHAGKKDVSKEQKFRLVVNMQHLNKLLTTKNNTACPSIPDLFRAMSGVRILSVLDLSAAYYSIQIEPKSRPLLAFKLDNRIFSYRRAPMGLSLSSGQFNATIQAIITSWKQARLDQIQ